MKNLNEFVVGCPIPNIILIKKLKQTNKQTNERNKQLKLYLKKKKFFFWLIRCERTCFLYFNHLS